MKKLAAYTLAILSILIMSCCILASCSNSNDDKSSLGLDSAYMLCWDFLNDYYQAVASGNDNFDIDKYVENENFINYIKAKTLTASSLASKISVTNGVVEVDWQEKYISIKIQTVVTDTESKHGSSVSEMNQFLLTPKNGRTYISDWYSMGTGSFDEAIRGDKKELSNPNIWENQEFVDKIKENVKKLEGAPKSL